ncbi:MAG TPA: penicillin-binding protein, partial [Mycobacterium sp.]|nr:penicillin-binding protein [Mycobacterium sp.]
MARARPVNSEGRHDRSASDVRRGPAADGVGPRPQPRSDGPARPDGGRHRPPASDAPRHRPPGASPDDRLTAVIPVVRNAPPAHLRDPIDVVKAALDGTPAPKQPPPPPPRQPPGGGGPPGGPPPPRRSSPQQINWKLVRRGLYVAAAVLIVLPLITFGMAYLIVDVPKPGDIRTSQVSTILA